MFTLTATNQIEDQRVKDLLTSALEGGSNYWYMITRHTYAPGLGRNDVEFPHIDLPFIDGGSLTIKADEDPKEYTLDRRAIEKGLRIMAEKYSKHFSDFMNENDDSITGDVFLQCCLFGELVYG
ncbi:MAG: hypothetical protein PHV74_00320 [Dehalococcoidia bacterium]|nr:hypothetical protein [Dehalococcoidia bacterium]